MHPRRQLPITASHFTRLQLRVYHKPYKPSSINSLVLTTLVICLICCFFVGLSHQQSSISLSNAEWFASNSNSSIVIPGRVPGGIYSDLRRANVLKQDPLQGKNDIAYRWVGHENWTYTALFAIDHQIASSQSVKLVLHGVDTISTIYLNGELIGTTDNMFVRYKFDIKSHLKLAGLQNIIVIKFESPIKYSARKSNQSIRNNRGRIIPPYCPAASQRGECHINFIRKMQASFSWDFGPAFPSVGLYKDIAIEFGSFGLIRDLLVETRRLPPLIAHRNRDQQTAPPQIIISSSIRQQVRTPTINKTTVPYLRAPPYYLPAGLAAPDNVRLWLDDPSGSGFGSSAEAAQAAYQSQLMEENWLLKTTLVAEMVKPSFGYNLRVEFSLNGILHYESEHINVVANSDGFIRLGFNLRIDQSRLLVKPWWPNNAGQQNLYQLSARIMPIPNPVGSQADKIQRLRKRRQASGTSDELANIGQPQLDGKLDHHQQNNNEPSVEELRSRARPHSTPATKPIVVLLATQQHQHDSSSYQIQHVSEKNINFGFRTVELIQEPVTTGQPEEGLTFQFRVNGIDLFAMGSNWIPAAILPEYSNDLEYVRYLLQSAKDANMNMLRVWGGGLYESDEFYKMADEMGIMIWQDFMFACALYPVDDDFLASVRLEIEQQVQRLQYHPSLVLWAGNNENEMAIAGTWWPDVMVWNKKLRESYSKLYVDTIRPIVQILDPTRPYVESSPSNGVLSSSQPNAIARTPNENKYGDVHHYEYWADAFDWSNYPSTRFASEFGFQSYPSFNALSQVTSPQDWKYPLSANILHRQHRMSGEVEIKHQIRAHFKDIEPGGVDKFKAFLYTSQLTQAIAIKTETEFYRRNRFINPENKLGKTMGALYWQLNDVWQAPTWSSIEHGGKWKMLHYFARRFFFPIQVMPYVIQAPVTVVNSTLAASQSSALLINGIDRQHINDPQQQQQLNQNQQQTPIVNMLVIDLVRDDLFYKLDSFNITVRLFRWTSFVPVWQESVYVKHTRPQNVTRIYEHDLAKITRQSGIVSLASGIFQVVIEQQQRLGLSQIDNYLMPVIPSRITAMRVAKIGVELVQGPFELAEVKQGSSSSSTSSPSSQWACAYRLTLVSDSIAMFVWLDLNFLNIVAPGQSSETLDNSADTSNLPPRASQNQNNHQHSSSVPDEIRLSSIPGVDRIDSFSHHQQNHHRPASHELPPDRILLHSNAQPIADLNSRMSSEGLNLSFNGSRASRFLRSTSSQPSNAAASPFRLPLIRPQISSSSSDVHNNNNNNNSNNNGGRRPTNTPSNQASSYGGKTKFKAAENWGSNSLRYQFSDNAFNMFEPSKVVDLYLARCLTKSQVEVALEVQSLADIL